jgi:hypothetical protein
VKEKSNVWLAVLLMVVFALTRWPGALPENFSAAYALAFCCGVFLPGRLAWWLPLATLTVTNVLLNVLHYHVPALSWYLLLTTASFGLLVWLGRAFQPGSAWWKLVGGGLLGSILFYVVSNTAAWLYESTQPYPKNLSGWIQALTVGTSGWPETWKFFRNTLLSGGLFTGLFVGAMKLGPSVQPAPDEEEAPSESAQEPSSPTEEAKARVLA